MISQQCFRADFLAHGNHPQFLGRTLWECRGKWKSFMWVPINSGNCSGSCSENCGFRIAHVVRCHSENGISHSENHFPNSESCSENTPELSESSENGLFTPRAFFLKLGWSPGFWISLNQLFFTVLTRFRLRFGLLVPPAKRPRELISDSFWPLFREEKTA